LHGSRAPLRRGKVASRGSRACKQEKDGIEVVSRKRYVLLSWGGGGNEWESLRVEILRIP